MFGVPTELRRPASLDRVHHLLLRGWDGMGTAVGFPIKAEDIGTFPRWGTELAPLGNQWHAVA